MADLSFPLQFKRQFSAPLDLDAVFATTAERTAYLTNPRRYPGQVVSCVDDPGVLYVLNASMDAWIQVGSGSSAPLSSTLAYDGEGRLSTVTTDLGVRTLTYDDNNGGRLSSVAGTGAYSSITLNYDQSGVLTSTTVS